MCLFWEHKFYSVPGPSHGPWQLNVLDQDEYAEPALQIDCFLQNLIQQFLPLEYLVKLYSLTDGFVLQNTRIIDEHAKITPGRVESRELVRDNGPHHDCLADQLIYELLKKNERVTNKYLRFCCDSSLHSFHCRMYI